MSILPQHFAQESIIKSNRLMTQLEEKGKFPTNLISDPNSVVDTPRPIVDINNQPFPTITKSLKVIEINKLCFVCKKVDKEKCIQLTSDEKICSNCLMEIIIHKLDAYPKSNLKVLNGQSVFSIQGNNNIIPLSFTECFNKLPPNKIKEIRQKISNKKRALAEEISKKCMICKSLLQKNDINIKTIEIEQGYNYDQHLFPEINYCTAEHFVCENCYKKWGTFTISNKINDNIVLKCSLCNVEHLCSNKKNNICIIC